MGLSKVPVDPVDQVQGTVGAKCKEIVGRDHLGLASLGEHKELREKGQCLEVDREGPQDLFRCLLTKDKTVVGYTTFLQMFK